MVEDGREAAEGQGALGEGIERREGGGSGRRGGLTLVGIGKVGWRELGEARDVVRGRNGEATPA